MKRWKIRAGGAGIAVVMVTMMSSGVAAAGSSQTALKGDWATFTRCPVSAASMLAADGVKVSDECLTSDSPSGSVKLGNTAATSGDTNLQLGVLLHTLGGATTPVAPSGGAIAAAPIQIPGGLLGLMCPSNIPLVTLLCNEINSNPLNAVTATISPAGNPSDLNIAAGLTTGEPIVTIPVKIQLHNPLLGSSCFIGSSSKPILLQPETAVVPPNITAVPFDPNGTSDPNGPLLLVTLSGGTLEDSTFAVPGANGCGPLGIADLAIDLKDGLPSPAGDNSLILNDVTVTVAAYGDPAAEAPHEGQAFSAAWHSAVLP
jgi:hypothetical protein